MCRRLAELSTAGKVQSSQRILDQAGGSGAVAGPGQCPHGFGCILGLSLLGRRFLLIKLICPDRGSMASAFSACTSLGTEGVEEDSMGSSQARESFWELGGLGWSEGLVSRYPSSATAWI